MNDFDKVRASKRYGVSELGVVHRVFELTDSRQIRTRMLSFYKKPAVIAANLIDKKTPFIPHCGKGFLQPVEEPKRALRLCKHCFPENTEEV